MTYLTKTLETRLLRTSALCDRRPLTARLRIEHHKNVISRHLSTLCMCTAAQTPTQKKTQNNKNDKNNKQKKGGQKNNGGNASTSSLEELRKVRIEKADALREIAHTQSKTSSSAFMPFAYRFDRTHYCRDLQVQYQHLQPGEEVELTDGTAHDKFAVCGRVMNKRVFGKLAFITIEDVTGTIQLQLSKSNLPTRGGEGEAETAQEESNDADDPVGSLAFAEMKKFLDLGDIVGGCGSLRKTDKGELSVNCQNFVILTKAIVPLPDKFHGLKDQEMKYRRRELDLLTGGQEGLARRAVKARAAAMRAMRDHLHSCDFTEVETPVLHKHAGGADARPFLTHHNALDKGLTLRIATELHLKRLVVGGLERVYEIGRVFRNEGVSTRHNPEFTSIEVYQAYADYHEMMQLTEDLIRKSAKEVFKVTRMADKGSEGGEDTNRDLDEMLSHVEYQGTVLNLRDPFKRVSMTEIVKEKTGVDPFQVWEEQGEPNMSTGASSFASSLVESLRGANLVQVGEEDVKEIERACAEGGAGHALAALFELWVEEGLVQPTFVTDLPLSVSPLAKPHRVHPDRYAERFELFICGRELANAFSELTDALDQKQRFLRQLEGHEEARKVMKEQGLKDQDMEYDIEVDEEFLSALEYGLPPTAGMGLGIDRLLMMLTDAPSIKDVICFPLLK